MSSIEADIEAITARDPLLGHVLSHLHKQHQGKPEKTRAPPQRDEGVRPNVTGTKDSK